LNIYERSIGFNDVDAAGLVFFGRFLGYGHEAMEALFGALSGGYQALISRRRVGLPAVHVEANYRAPLAYGDAARIETSVRRVGRRSLTFCHRFIRVRDGVLAAEVLHTVACMDLVHRAGCDMPDDVRRLAEAHLEAS
jgi:4-hydroxybenzoyl-CoA thioesterase